MTRTNHAQQPRPTSPVVILLATALACLPLLALAQFNAHARVDEYDAWLFAYYGRQLLSGATLYGEVWDNKPPGIFWMNALGLALAGGSLKGMWTLCALAVVGAAAVCFAATRRLYGWSAAAIATVLAALYVNIWHYHVGCNRPNTFLVLTELGCFALYCRALTGTGRGRGVLLLAGLCGGAGICFKQSALAVSAAVVIHVLYSLARRRLTTRDAVVRLAIFGAGWCITVGVVISAILATADARWAWDAIVGFNRMYFQPGGGASLIPTFHWVEPYLKTMGLPLILAAATLVQPLLRRWLGGVADDEPADAVGRRPDGLLFLLWAWMLVAVYLALVGPHQRVPYLAVALPPLIMLCAHGVHLLLRSGRRIQDTKPAYHVVVGALWFAYMMIWPVWMQIDMAGRQYYHRFIAPPNERVLKQIAAIQRYSDPQDAMFIFGYSPDIYWRVDRRPAIRYIGTEKAEQLGEHGQPLMDRIAALLIEAEPRIILFHAEAFARAPQTRNLDVTAFEQWLRERYDQPEGEMLPSLWVRSE